MASFPSHSVPVNKWLDNGNDTSDSDKGDENNDEGPSYTSGEEDESGPAILNPEEWRCRHVRENKKCSRFRKAVRPYRVHYFHNQSDGNLYRMPIMKSLLYNQLNNNNNIERIQYNKMIENKNSFHRFSVGSYDNTLGYSIGLPVLLTSIPGTIDLQNKMSINQLCLPSNYDILTNKQNIQNTQMPDKNNNIQETDDQDEEDRKEQTLKTTSSSSSSSSGQLSKKEFGRVRVRVCQPFVWGSQMIDGRLALAHYVRLISQYPKADIPFYVFEDDIGGNTHTAISYHDVDEYINEELGKKEQNLQINKKTCDTSTTSRHDIGKLYKVPSLFQHCKLTVPYVMRPRASDGVLIIGPERTGSYPHIDPSSTSAWNWLLHGRKRWVMFPPNINPKHIGIHVNQPTNDDHGNNKSNDEENNENVYDKLVSNGAGYWWSSIYPQLIRTTDNNSLSQGARLGMLECIQEPGEIIYVPQGWWHAVLNISNDMTIAITHNLVLKECLPSAMKRESVRRPNYAIKWLKCLKKFKLDDYNDLLSKIPDTIQYLYGYEEKEKNQKNMIKMKKRQQQDQNKKGKEIEDDDDDDDEGDDESGLVCAEETEVGAYNTLFEVNKILDDL